MARKLSIPEKEAKARLNERTGLLLILVLAAGMRLFNLGGFSMWFDEAYSWHLAKESVSRIIELARIDNTPPVYHIFLHYWLKAGAVSDFMIRLPAAIFGILSVLFTFKLGKLVFDRRTALTAALLSAASFQLVHYSQENRMYSLQLLLGLISTYYFVLGLRTEERKHWLLWAGATVLSFYTQLFTVFLVFAQWVYFILTINANRKNIINWAAVNALVFIVCLPWLTVVFSQMGAIQDDYWVLPATLQEAVKAGFRLMGGTDIGDRYLLTALLNIPFILASIYGLVSLYRDRKGGDRLLFPLLFFLPIAVVYAISVGGQSLFYYRYFVFLIPYLLLIIAFGLSRPAGWWQRMSANALVTVSGMRLKTGKSMPRPVCASCCGLIWWMRMATALPEWAPKPSGWTIRSSGSGPPVPCARMKAARIIPSGV